jgi:hypothetical protein
MAQFLGSVKGARGEATRLGHKSTGLRTTANGWNLGAYASIVHVNGEDIVSVSITRGSNGGGNDLRLGSYKIVDNEIVKI